MTEPITLDDLSPERAVSRRNLFLGAGAAALAGGMVMSAADTVLAASPHPAVLSAADPALTYLPIDGFDFHGDTNYAGTTRYASDQDGVGLNVGGELAATLPLPTGATIRQINIAYRGSPIINVFKRAFGPPPTTTQYISTALTPAGTSGTQSFDLTTPIVIEAACSYSLRFYVSPGSTIFGVTVGYTPPLQGFVAATGSPRVLDTRTGGGKLLPAEERLVTVGVAGARSALFNLAVVNTEGTTASPGGFVACFPANVAYPSNSSINWFGSNQILSNSVLCALDANGAIKIRGGANKTDVVIDRIGYFY